MRVLRSSSLPNFSHYAYCSAASRRAAAGLDYLAGRPPGSTCRRPSGIVLIPTMSSLNAAGGRTSAVPPQSASFILCRFFLPGKVVGTILRIAPAGFLNTEPGEYVAHLVALCACRPHGRCKSCTMCRFPCGGLNLKLVRRLQMRCEQLLRNHLKPSNSVKEARQVFRFSSSFRASWDRVCAG